MRASRAYAAAIALMMPLDAFEAAWLRCRFCPLRHAA